METEKTSQTVPRRRKMRSWIPAVIIAIAVASITFLTRAPELPIIKKILYSMLTVLGSALLLLVWFLFL